MNRARSRRGNPEPSQSFASWIGAPTSAELVRYVALITGNQGRVMRDGGVNIAIVPPDMVPRVEATLRIVHPTAKVRAEDPAVTSSKEKA